MWKYSRRDFLWKSLVGAGVVAASRSMHAEVDPKGAFKADDIVPLGRTGIKVSRLAQGTGHNGWARQCDHTRMGKQAFDRLLRHGLDRGIKFIDTADLYGTHPFVSDVIKGIPRDRFVLLSKIWVRKEKWIDPSGGAVEELNRFRQELGVDVIDVCLIHCAQNTKWTDDYKRVRDDLSALKQSGVVRAVGVSCHDLGALRIAGEHPWVDVIFARVNHKCGKDYATDGTVEQVSEALKAARKNGKAVVGMKIFGNGKLTNPDEKDASLKFVLNNGLVDAMTIGMTSPEQVDDTFARMSQVTKA